MKYQTNWGVAYAVAAILAGSIALAAEQPPFPPAEMPTLERPAKPALRPKPPAHALVEMPAPEPATATTPNAGFSTQSAFADSSVPSSDSSNLSPPVSITYSGSSPVLQINNSGTGKGVYSNTTNTHNASSALFGQTNGSGAGLTGYNSGTAGPAGKFGITNSSSAQAGVFATTNGTGPAVLATIIKANSEEPAILGQNSGSAHYGTGVEGQGNEYGVYGNSDYTGVYGSGTEFGVVANSLSGTALYGSSSAGEGMFVYGGGGYGAYVEADAGIGVYGYSNSNYGMSAESYTGTGLLAKADGSGTGVRAASASGYGVYATSTSGVGLLAESTNGNGVVGQDNGNGVGVFGYSQSGFAGLFQGKVSATSYITQSDRNAKTKIHPVDGKAILDQVDRMPVSWWVFKDDPKKNHVGPMAQDFHAAFGLDGDDDKHINLTDIAGVSLASIQELSREMKEKDAKIAELQDQLKAMSDTFSARVAALEQQQQWLGVATQIVNLKKETASPGE